MSQDYILETRSLVKEFRGFVAVNGVNGVQKAQEVQKAQQIQDTVVFFGSARIHSREPALLNEAVAIVEGNGGILAACCALRISSSRSGVQKHS